jgi:hypothetical protein
VQQIEKCLKKENNAKLLESLKIQNFLMQEYETAIKNEKLAIRKFLNQHRLTIKRERRILSE